MCKWNDVFTSDESKRQDKLTDAKIKLQSNAFNWTIGMALLVVVFAAFLFYVGKDASAASVLIAALITSVLSRVLDVFTERKNTSASPHDVCE
ncbi:MAG: hypothetical protein FWE94_08065 [Coriobacteriia bacterium]|nr:hypothetical protein [Coriobacteriia bacterium]